MFDKFLQSPEEQMKEIISRDNRVDIRFHYFGIYYFLNIVVMSCIQSYLQ